MSQINSSQQPVSKMSKKQVRIVEEVKVGSVKSNDSHSGASNVNDPEEEDQEDDLG